MTRIPPPTPPVTGSSTTQHRCPTCGQPLPSGFSPVSAEDWPGQRTGLNRRESQVVALIADGLSNEQIAETLYLGLNTIKTYVRTAYRKMGVDTRTRAVLWAIDAGVRERPQHSSPVDASDPPAT